MKNNIDILQKQFELVKRHWPETFDDKIKSTNNMVLGIVGELSELMEGYKALPWKPEREEREYILEEITDLLHYVLELYLIWDIKTMDEIENLYFQKHNKNVDRGKVHEKHSNDLMEN